MPKFPVDAPQAKVIKALDTWALRSCVKVRTSL